MKKASSKKSKRASAKKGTTVAKKETSRDGLIPLKKICAELGIEPKAARVRLRRFLRREEDPGVKFHKIGSRWDLSKKEAAEVRAFLAG